MGRRILLLIGISLLSLAGVLIGHSPGIASMLGTGASSVPASSPAGPLTPDIGLGNTREAVELALGPPTGLKGTMLAYRGGIVAISYQNGRANALLLSLGNDGTTLERARQTVQAVLPTDRVLVGTMKAGYHRIADVYQSPSLGGKMTPANAAPPTGQFVVVFEDTGAGNVREALLAVGDVPQG